MLTTILAYILIVAFSIGEGRCEKASRRRPTCRQLRPAEHPPSGHGVRNLHHQPAGCPLLNYLTIGLIVSATMGWMGCNCVRWHSPRVWANRVLGAFYTRTLRVLEDQSVVQRAPIASSATPAIWG